MDETLLRKIKSKRIAIPNASDTVYKNECLLSCDSPFSPSGIFVNLSTWYSYGKDMLRFDHDSKDDGSTTLYLNIKSKRVKKEEQQKVNVLAIGVEGGFSADDGYETHTEYALFIHPDERYIAVPCEELPDIVTMAIDAIICHSGNIVQEEIAAWQEEIRESKYADDLIQLDNGVKASPDPSKWTCGACGAKENLWMNLSDGYIGCGRKNWDGSGGCGESLVHYENEGSKYHLAVKLGTITPEGADVFSYSPDENDMVKDKHLEKHLLHWGINLANMKKTEKTVNELQINLNENYEFDKITEAGKDLIPLNGAGYVGLKNLGNSCYVNSVLQVLLAIPEIQRQYLSESIIQTHHDDIANDFAVQMCKVATAVLTDRYCGGERNIEIKPQMLKTLVGKNHVDFRTGQQQDAVEYFQHLVDFMHRHERTEISRLGTNAESPRIFQFNFEDRIQCLESNKVKYVCRKDRLLQLQIPMTSKLSDDECKAYKESQVKRQKLNSDDKQETPVVPFSACLESAFTDEIIDDFMSSATNRKGRVRKNVRFKTFPSYLVVQLRRYYVAEDWTPKKIDVLVPVPEEIDLECYRSTGPVDGESLLEDAAVVDSADSIVPDAELVTQLISMGFSENGCKRAAIATGNSNAEAAMEWIFAHMEDSNFNDPPEMTKNEQATGPCNQEHVAMLSSMGFSRAQAEAALQVSDGVPDRAAEWLFSHSDDLDGAIAASLAGKNAPGSEASVGDASAKGEYRLLGFISHMGSNTACGHYVCHIKKHGRWAIFNDEKVAESDSPPLDLGYMYVFQRKDLITN